MSKPIRVIKTGHEARKALAKGVDFLADTVQATIGPHGQNFLLEKGNKITNDGKNIASALELQDEIAQRGLVLAREAGVKTEEEVYDASSTAIMLTRAIFKEASKQLPNEKQAIGKMTPSEVIIEVEKERQEVNRKLDTMVEKIQTEQDLINSALVSTENKELAELIGKTQWELGPEGVIIAEQTNDKTCSIERVKGVLVDNGFSASGVINNIEKQALICKNVKILYTNHIIQGLKPLEHIYLPIAKAGNREFVIMARGFAEQAIKDCEANVRAGFNIYPLNAPFTDQVEIMKDLEAVLGGTFVNLEQMELDEIQLSDVGFASVVEAKRWASVFTGVDDEKTRERTEKRVADIKERFKGVLSVFEEKNLQKRLGQLQNGFAILKVGSESDAERKRLFDKADDAVGAIRIAFQEGVVPGAGLAFKQIADEMPDAYLLKRPLASIYEQIMFSSPKVFVIEKWVKDPVKVLKTALKYACSVGTNLATAAGADATGREKVRYVQETNQNEDTEE